MQPEAILHIGGFCGAGKTTLGKKIQNRFGERVVVKELDDFLPPELTSDKKAKSLMERRMTSFLSREVKPVVFIGTGCNHAVPHELFPRVPARHHTWLNVSLHTATIRALQRQLQWLQQNQSNFLRMSQEFTKKEFANYLISYYSYHQRKSDWKGLRANCKKYVTMNEKDILSLIERELECKVQSTPDNAG